MGFSRVSKLGSTLTLEHFLLIGEEVDENILARIEEQEAPSILPLRLIKGEEKNNLADKVVQFRCEVRKLSTLKNRMTIIQNHAEFVDLVLQIIRVMDDCTGMGWSLDNLHLSRDGYNLFFNEKQEIFAIYWPLKKNRFKNDAWDFFYILPYMMRNDVLSGDRFFELYWSRIQQYRHEPFSTRRLMEVLSQANQSQVRGEFLPREIQSFSGITSPANDSRDIFHDTSLINNDWQEGTEPLGTFDSTGPVNFTEFSRSGTSTDWVGTDLLGSASSYKANGGTESLESYGEETQLMESEVIAPFGIQVSMDGMRRMHFRKNDGQLLPMYGPSVILGSSSEKADLVIQGNKKISRKHAKVVYRNGVFYITDLGSRNGTFLEGQRLDPHREYPMTVPCQLQLANCDLIFEQE